MIRLRPTTVRWGDRFFVEADEPVTVEVSYTPQGGLQAFVYRGPGPLTEDDEPVGAYDSTIHLNKPWEVGT